MGPHAGARVRIFLGEIQRFRERRRWNLRLTAVPGEEPLLDLGDRRLEHIVGRRTEQLPAVTTATSVRRQGQRGRQRATAR